MIGPRQDASDRGGVLPIFVRRALAGEPLLIEGDGQQTRSFTSVHDAVAANLIAAVHADARGALLHCASAVRVSVAELAAYVLERTGSRAARGTSRRGPATSAGSRSTTARSTARPALRQGLAGDRARRDRIAAGGVSGCASSSGTGT